MFHDFFTFPPCKYLYFPRLLQTNSPMDFPLPNIGLTLKGSPEKCTITAAFLRSFLWVLLTGQWLHGHCLPYESLYRLTAQFNAGNLNPYRCDTNVVGSFSVQELNENRRKPEQHITLLLFPSVSPKREWTGSFQLVKAVFSLHPFLIRH